MSTLDLKREMGQEHEAYDIVVYTRLYLLPPESLLQTKAKVSLDKLESVRKQVFFLKL